MLIKVLGSYLVKDKIIAIQPAFNNPLNTVVLFSGEGEDCFALFEDTCVDTVAAEINKEILKAREHRE